MRQVAAEEVSAQGTQIVEVSNRNIGARLAALRSVVRGIGPQRIALQRHGPMLHGTLVASLSPSAALSSTESAQTPNPFSRLGLFANGTFSAGDKDVTSNEPGFDFNTYGGTAGVDYRFTNNVLLGAAFSYQATDADLDDTISIGLPGLANGGGVDTKGYTGSIYGTYYVSNKFYIDGIISFGWNDYETDRPITYNVGTDVNQVAHSDTDGTQFSFSFGAGYDFNTGGLTFGPFARINYINLDIDGYREEIGNTNPGFGWALEFDDQDVESLTSVLGVQASYAISTGLGVLLPQVRFEWEHEFKDNSRTITARFINDPARAPIAFSTDDPDRDFFNLGVGLSATFRGGVSAFVYYETVLGLEDLTRHSVTIGVRKEL